MVASLKIINDVLRHVHSNDFLRTQCQHLLGCLRVNNLLLGCTAEYNLLLGINTRMVDANMRRKPLGGLQQLLAY